MPASINDLPFETLNSIFLLYYSSDTFHKVRTYNTPEPPALSLGRVCSRWRLIAAATPQLWTMIYVKCCSTLRESPSPPPTWYSAELDRYDLRVPRLFLSNCGPSLPLTLQLDWHHVDERYEEGRSSFTELVTPYSSRWTNMDLVFFLEAEGVSFIAKTMKGFTSLTDLRITLPDSSIPPDEFLRSGHGTFCDGDITIPSVLHLSLDFRVVIDPSAEAVPVLGSLRFPSLVTFTLLLNKDVDEENSDHYWDLFIGMLDQLKPPLRSIHTTFLSSPSPSFDGTEILRLTPHLVLADQLFLSERFLEELASINPDSGAAEIAPNLKEICIFNARGVRDVDMVTRVLSLRWRGGKGPLKKVTVLSHTQYLALSARTKLRGLEIVENSTFRNCL